MIHFDEKTMFAITATGQEKVRELVAKLEAEYPGMMKWPHLIESVAGIDPHHGGLRGTCTGCPFNEGMTEEADRAAEAGCLPSAGEIMNWKREGRGNWGCHSENKVCTGLCHAAKIDGLRMNEGATIRDAAYHNTFGESNEN